MKIKISIACIAILLLAAVSLQALEWKDRAAIGIRGPMFIPYDDIWGPEPYSAGKLIGLDFKYGLTNTLIANLYGNYAITYDDTTATKDMNTKIWKKENSYTKLDGFLFGANIQYHFMPGKTIRPFILVGLAIDNWKITTLEDRAGVAKGSTSKISDVVADGGLGFAFHLSENLIFDLQGKIAYGLAKDNKSVKNSAPPYNFANWDKREFRGHIDPSIGLTYVFGGAKDTDQDGVNDKKDQCPDTPVGCLVDKVGCPLDADGDGVCDGLDKCPDTPKGAKVDLTGCPQDSDGDGVYDGLDKCPDTPKGCKIDATGCPIDSDGDGVCDGLDQCPDTRQGCTVDANGCPMDGDGDGVCDGLDKCPTTPPGTQVDSIGCPINVKPPVKKITLNIKYKTGSYEPDAASKKVLDDLAQTLLAYTGTNIEIDGFTDDVGKEAANQTLSENRANGVRDYLVKKGVPAERMTTKGYGENPQYFVGDNKTAEGRQMNRRVEIVSTEVQ